MSIYFFAGRIHHSLAVKASDYKKKQYVFRLTTADYAEYLFQTGCVSVSAWSQITTMYDDSKMCVFVLEGVFI